MHERALCFYLQYAKQLMHNSECKLFVARTAGGTYFKSVDYVINTFRRMGFELLYSERYFTVFVLNDKKQILPVHIGDLLRKERFQDAFQVCGNLLDKIVSMIYSAEQKVPLSEMEEYFHTLDDNLDSPDEEFFRYCGVYRKK